MKTKINSLAFTRLELAALVAGLALTALLALPMVAGPSTRADRVACMNNLRQLGQAFNLWASEHRDTFPWHGNYDANDPLNSGTRGHPFHEQLWFQFFCLSNELKNPAALACPGDQRLARKTARTWDRDPNGGYLNGAYKQNAISYLLNLHVEAIHPKTVVALDRNIPFTMRGGCSFLFSSTATLYSYDYRNLAWTNDVHGLGAGNVLFMDGQVLQAGDAGLREAFFMINTMDTTHLLFPF